MQMLLILGINLKDIFLLRLQWYYIESTLLFYQEETSE